MTLTAFKNLFRKKPALIGVVHLLPLPGSPRYQGEFSAVLDQAVRDARIYTGVGFDGLIVENFGDAPFYAKQVGPETVAAMTAVVREIRSQVDVPVGINVLRNDPRAALSIATAAGGAFVRVNVHSGVMVTDQGILEGDAAGTLRFRRLLMSNAWIFADLLVKHAAPLVPAALEQVAVETVERGLADALVLTGRATGTQADPQHVLSVKKAVPNVPVLVGSGITPDNVAEFAAADGFIVGTSAKVGGKTTAPVDPLRARALVQTVENMSERQ